jgi:nucleoside-diphosphate-sugar epimerase
LYSGVTNTKPSEAALTAPGRVATEEDSANSTLPRKSEEAAGSAAAGSARVSLLRLPPSVHGVGDDGFVPILIRLAREKGVSAYVGQGLNRWPAVHRLDAARLYRLVLEERPMAPRYYAVADGGVPFREIAQVIGRRLNIPIVSRAPEEASDHFGWFAHFAALDCPASSAQTQEQSGWCPTQASLIPISTSQATLKRTSKRLTREEQRNDNAEQSWRNLHVRHHDP